MIHEREKFLCICKLSFVLVEYESHWYQRQNKDFDVDGLWSTWAQREKCEVVSQLNKSYTSRCLELTCQGTNLGDFIETLQAFITSYTDLLKLLIIRILHKAHHFSAFPQNTCLGNRFRAHLAKVHWSSIRYSCTRAGMAARGNQIAKNNQIYWELS